MPTNSAPLYERFSITPYLSIYQAALQQGGVTSRQVANLLGMTEGAAKRRLYRLVWIGALLKTMSKRQVVYHPGNVDGCTKLIEIGKSKSIRWVDYEAQASPPGAGANL